MMESGDERGVDLFHLSQAVNRCMADDESRMTGMIVIVDDFSHIVQAGCRDQKPPFLGTVAVQGLQLVEEHCRYPFYLLDMLVVRVGQGLEEIRNALFQDIVEAWFFHIGISGVVFEEQAFTQAAAADDEFLTARERK